MRKTDADRWLLDYFRLNRTTGVVHWATQEEMREEPGRKVKRIPFGQKAGGRYVLGHGHLVAFSGRNLLTCDIREAIAKGYQWPWDAANAYTVEGDYGMPAHRLAERTRFILDTWKLDKDGVVWRKDTPPQYPANAVVVGTVIAGRNEVMVTRKGVGHMLKDIRFVLENGYLPGQKAHEWE